MPILNAGFHDGLLDRYGLFRCRRVGGADRLLGASELRASMDHGKKSIIRSRDGPLGDLHVGREVVVVGTAELGHVDHWDGSDLGVFVIVVVRRGWHRCHALARVLSRSSSLDFAWVGIACPAVIWSLNDSVDGADTPRDLSFAVGVGHP